MTDLVKRLRRRHGLTHDPDQLWGVISTLNKDADEAADEIERLRAQVKELDSMWRAAAKKKPGQIYATWCDECPHFGGCGNCQHQSDSAGAATKWKR